MGLGVFDERGRVTTQRVVTYFAVSCCVGNRFPQLTSILSLSFDRSVGVVDLCTNIHRIVTLRYTGSSKLNDGHINTGQRYNTVSN